LNRDRAYKKQTKRELPVMPNIYCAYVCVDTNVLAKSETARMPTKIPGFVPRLLEKIGRHDSKMSYAYERDVFHVIVEHRFVYICVADEESGQRIPFSFLGEMKERFCQRYAKGKPYPEVNSLPNVSDFKMQITSLIRFYNENPDSDKIAKVKSQINEVQTIMTKNIDDVIARGERIEDIVGKTEQLNQNAQTFKRGARTLKRTMQWKRIVCIAVVVGTILLVVGVVVVIVLKPWQKK